EEVASADDERAHAVARRGFKALLHLHPDPALARQWMLRRVLVEEGKCVRAEIVDGAGKDDAGPRCACRRDRALQHRHRKAAPVAIAGWIDGMDDDLHAGCGCNDLGGLHGIALHPFDAAEFRLPGPRLIRLAMQGPHAPAAADEGEGDLAAD